MSTVDPDTNTPWGAPPPPPPPAMAHHASSVGNPPPPPPPPRTQTVASFAPTAPPVPAPPPGPGGYIPAQATTAPPAPYLHPMGSPPPEDRRRNYLQVAVAVAIAAVVVGLGFFAVRLATPKWDPILEPYVAYIEAERGLTFDHPVDVRWADIAQEIRDSQAAYEASASINNNVVGTLTQDEDDVVELSDPWSDAYQLLGLVDPNPEQSLAEGFTDTLAENAGAFYQPATETIVLPMGESEAALSLTIVHELMHALQDQHGMLGDVFDSADGYAARTALIEGDAERIAMAWYWSRTDAERETFLDAIDYDPDEPFEDPGDNYLAASFYASYAVGLPMAQTIVQADGVSALNQLLLANDAGTTERLIDPLETSFVSALDIPSEMTLPDGADAPIGDLGALTWFQVLAPTIGTEAALEAVLGYDDDGFAIVTSSNETCGRFVVSFDTDVDAEEFSSAISTMGAAPDLIEIKGESAVQIDLCTPIGDPQKQHLGTIMPLVIVNEMTLYHLQGGVSAGVARCAAIAHASTVPADRAIDDVQIDWELVGLQSAQYLDECR